MDKKGKVLIVSSILLGVGLIFLIKKPPGIQAKIINTEFNKIDNLRW